MDFTITMEKDKKPIYKYCIVPMCKNTVRNSPDKLFFLVPRGADIRKKWCKNMKRHMVSPSTCLYCCEDHFNATFGASNVEVCRICLATDVKMYSLQDTHLGRCIESVTGIIIDKSDEVLPKYVCYECAACLIKCNKLIEKSRIAQATVQDIFTKNGQVTKSLIKEKNRAELNLQSPLEKSIVIDYYIGNNIDLNTSNCIKVETDPDEKIDQSFHKDTVISEYSKAMEETELDEQLDNKLIIYIKEEPSHEDIDTDTINMVLVTEGTQMDEICSGDDKDIPVVKDPLHDSGSNENDFISLKPYQRTKGLVTHKHDKPTYDEFKMRLAKIKAMKGKNINKSTSEETLEEYIKQYFNVDVERVQKANNIKYSCKLCSKSFYDITNAKDHSFISCSIEQNKNRAKVKQRKSPAQHQTEYQQRLNNKQSKASADKKQKKTKAQRQREYRQRNKNKNNEASNKESTS